jgi:DivIVA domain-containing protein
LIFYPIQESSDLELKRELIERKDFPPVRRGFDSKAVQDHLYEVAKAVAEVSTAIPPPRPARG